MLIKNAKEILLKAKESHFAIPSCNYIDNDSARIFCANAASHRLPLILSFAEVHKTILPIEEAAVIGKYFAERYDAPVILHLDHGMEVDYCLKAIDLGFSSVMIDASSKSFEENVATTKEVVDYAHKRGVQVEAEIGHVGSNALAEDTSLYTQPEEAARFVAQSGCDSLAVSIGTSHGVYKTGTPKLSFDALSGIVAALPDTPLVLHGGSGTGDENLSRCAREGIAKINIFTDFYVAALAAVKAPEVPDILTAKAAYTKAIEETLLHYYKVFGTK